MGRLGAFAAVGALTTPLGGTVAGGTLGAFGDATFKKLAAHRVRFGMRWSSDDAVLAK